MSPATIRTIFMFGLMMSTSGCWGGCQWEGDEWEDGEEGGEPIDPPTVDVVIASWPPIGPAGHVSVSAYSDGGLDQATAYFARTSSKSFGLYGDVQFSGTDLGEGMGTLEIEVMSNDTSWTSKFVDDLLVDLTAPIAYVDETVLAGNVDLELWVADAWVVSSYSLSVNGSVLAESTLEPGYPSTLGVDFDYWFVSVPGSQLPAGVHDAILVVTDAAGNEASFTLPLTVDPTPPIASIVAPAEGASASGAFDVVVDASDDLGAETTVEIHAGGTLVATGIGPTATVSLDAAELAEGPIEIVVVARDEAGNASAPVSRNIVVQH